MRQAAIGLTTVEQTKKAFPGYVHKISKTNPSAFEFRASWVVQIMPAIEQSQLYQNWMNPALAVNWANDINRGQYITQLNILQCASNANPDIRDDALSYVVNTGVVQKASDNYVAVGSTLTAPSWPEDSASGVCFNQSLLDYASAPGAKKVNMDYISTHDGSTNTLLVTENLQSGGWARDPDDISYANLPFQTDFAARQSVGTVWFITGNENNFAPPTTNMASNYNPNAIGINEQSQTLSGRPVGTYVPANLSTPSGLAYARPSANHSGGINAMFCGGNGRFLAEEIDYKVVTQLMTPFQNQVIVDYEGTIPMNPVKANRGVIGSTPTATSGANQVKVPWDYILNEADF